MTTEWQEQVNARNRERQRRQARCLYGSKYQMFITKMIKRPLMTIMSAVLHQMPEPTIENTWHPNAHRMITVRDEFKVNCSLPPERKDTILAMMNFAIMLYDYDPPYRDLMDWAKERIDELGWEPRFSMNLIAHNWKWWNEDKKGG